MASNETSSLTVDGAQPQNVPNSGCTAVFEGRGVLSQRLGLMVLGLMLATLFVLIRCVYIFDFSSYSWSLEYTTDSEHLDLSIVA
jgi:hypothetical protein